MKDCMFTYHYYRNRCLMRPGRTSDFVMGGIIFLGLCFFIISISFAK